MNCIVAGHTAVTAKEFAELALGLTEYAPGFDPELFTGTANELEEDRAARLAVARDVLADLRQVDPAAAAYARALLKVSDLPTPAPRTRRARRGRRAPVCTALGQAVAA
ncbi:hypothetical protein DEJ48_10740 [Streptomyces venezuelae]|uniref:Uncharacterized protein n=1 Tax=Streptomyces venezuelae TaxID=54571 RepID=A0A5P2BZJ9_STRVZ|nr:hypothetical protein [Streptomyces venezuelae]QES33799.1 hypothetical protein DEJ48_10740 [Streptomyces venezuelae]